MARFTNCMCTKLFNWIFILYLDRKMKFDNNDFIVWKTKSVHNKTSACCGFCELSTLQDLGLRIFKIFFTCLYIWNYTYQLYQQTKKDN